MKLIISSHKTKKKRISVKYLCLWKEFHQILLKYSLRKGAKAKNVQSEITIFVLRDRQPAAAGPDSGRAQAESLASLAATASPLASDHRAARLATGAASAGLSGWSATGRVIIMMIDSTRLSQSLRPLRPESAGLHSLH